MYFEYTPAFGGTGATYNWNLSNINIVPLLPHFGDPITIEYQGETNPLENDIIVEYNTDPYSYYYLTGTFVYKLEGAVSFAEGIYTATYTKKLIVEESSVTSINQRHGSDGPVHDFEWSEDISVAEALDKRLGELITDGSEYHFLWAHYRIVGTSASEIFHFDQGDDKLEAKGGDDIIFSSWGRDRLSGGYGADTFAFVSVRDSNKKWGLDVITDFKHGRDKIDLELIDAGRGGDDQAFKFRGEADFSGRKSQLIFEHEGHGMNRETHVYADVNSDKKSDFHLTLDGHINLTASDFVL